MLSTPKGKKVIVFVASLVVGLVLIWYITTLANTRDTGMPTKEVTCVATFNDEALQDLRDLYCKDLGGYVPLQ